MEVTVLKQAREQRVDELIAAENTRDLGRIESMLYGDAEFDDAAWGERSRGSWTGVPDWHRKMWSAFPDLRFVVKGKRTDEAGRIVVATPTAALSTVREMRADVDELIAVMTPADFAGVGQWYEDFSQTTDEEVTELLGKSQWLPEAR